MSHNSTRLLIPIADLTDAADVPASIAAAIAVIDANAAWISKGTFAARPAAGTVAGKLYYATDTGAFYVTDGTTWQLVNPYPTTDAAVGVGSLRTLGSGALQAAPGNDARLSDTRTPSPLSVVTSTIAGQAVTFAKLGFAVPMVLQKIGYNGSGFTTPGTNARAGRVLGPTDFSTLLGMTIPKILVAANGTVTDTSGNAVTITNNGSVVASGLDGSGIDGLSGTAFKFDGSTQYLTAPNTVKQKYGTWGCWIKCSSRVLPTPADQVLIAMWQVASSDQSFRLVIEGTTGLLRGEVSTGGGSLVGAKSYSHTIVADEMWHFVAMSWDGAKLCIYVDGVLEGAETVTLAVANPVGQGPLNQSAALLLSIAATSNGGLKYEGKMSNIYVTGDVLEENAHRLLYAKKYAHALGQQPELFIVNVRKKFRSKTYAAADFTSMTSFGGSLAQPLLGSNFESNTWVNDFGSLANAISASIADSTIPYPFQGQQGSGVNHGGFYFNGTNVIQGPDTGLPAGASPPMTYGVWIRVSAPPPSGVQVIFTYGTAAANAGRCLWIDSNGTLFAGKSGQPATTLKYDGIVDGQWHFVVVTENNSGVTVRKLYVDAQMVASDTTLGGTVTLGGAVGLNIGRDLSAASFFIGSMAGFFITGSILIGENVRELFSKLGAGVISYAQPVDPMNFIERADSTNIYWIGDDLEPTDEAELIIV